MVKAYSYIRFSTPDQMRGDSLRRQLEASEKYAEKHGLDLDTSLRDLGVSGYRGDHVAEGSLGKFMKLVEAGRIERGSYLLVESLDRLSRQEIDIALEQFLRILRAGIIIVTLQDMQVYSHPPDLQQLIISITIMSRAYEESRAKGVRLREAWGKKKKDAAGGKPLSRMCPAWIMVSADGNRYEPMPERAAIVRRVFEETASGIGADLIAKRLNDEGVSNWGRRVDGWHGSYIKKMLDGERARGVYQPMKRVAKNKSVPDGPPIEGYYPAVVPDDLFYRAKRASAERRTAAGRRGKKFANLFRGLAFCSECGRAMRSINKGPARHPMQYMVCSGALRHQGCAQRTHHRYDKLEAAILSGVRELDFSAIVQDRDAVADARAEVTTLSAKAAGLADQRRRLIDEFGGDGDDDLIADRIRKLKSEHDATTAALKKAKAALKLAESGADDLARHADELGKLMALQESADEAERFRLRAAMHQALSDIVDQIKIRPDGSGILTLRQTFTAYHLIDGRLHRVDEQTLFDVLAAIDGL